MKDPFRWFPERIEERTKKRHRLELYIPNYNYEYECEDDTYRIAEDYETQDFTCIHKDHYETFFEWKEKHETDIQIAILKAMKWDQLEYTDKTKPEQVIEWENAYEGLKEIRRIIEKYDGTMPGITTKLMSELKDALKEKFGEEGRKHDR